MRGEEEFEDMCVGSLREPQWVSLSSKVASCRKLEIGQERLATQE